MLEPAKETQDKPKTALVIRALLRKDPRFDDPLSEIRSLAHTAGIEVVDALVQRLDRPISATYLGKGKVQEASERAAELDVDFILADNDLSPAQERNLEKASERTVVDRSQLIMDIFARRAQTHQARLQVELAQLRYSLPRLKRMWTHLSRYEGGIGMRGPGEKQLETDKRIVRKRISRMVRELALIEKRKESTREGRGREFVVAVVGYTNAGKSTLLNALTGSKELVEDKLFATLDTRVRRWMLNDHRHVLLTDTVGFIRHLPHHLVASFRATLAETQRADLLLHVVDASSQDAVLHIQTVNEVLKDLECDKKPTWLVLNKWDNVEEEQIIEARSLGGLAASEIVDTTAGASVSSNPWESRSLIVSSHTREGLDELKENVLDYVQREDSRLELEVPHARGDVIAYLRENAEIETTDYRTECVYVAFEISPARRERLRRIFPEGFPEQPAKRES
jgi:GTP-binding protein HflX